MVFLVRAVGDAGWAVVRVREVAKNKYVRIERFMV